MKATIPHRKGEVIPRKNQRGGSGEGGRFQECTTVHRTEKFGFNGTVAMVGWWRGEGYSVKKEEGGS